MGTKFENNADFHLKNVKILWKKEKMVISCSMKTKGDGTKLMLFLKSAPQSYLETPIAMPKPEHSKFC